MQTAFTTEVLRQTLADVEQDEARAIAVLVNLLEKVRETSRTAPLDRICKVVSEWQNSPPGGIVTALEKIREDLGWPTSDNL